MAELAQQNEAQNALLKLSTNLPQTLTLKL